MLGERKFAYINSATKFVCWVEFHKIKEFLAKKCFFGHVEYYGMKSYLQILRSAVCRVQTDYRPAACLS